MSLGISLKRRAFTPNIPTRLISGTFLEDRKINNPDSLNSGYIVIHGVPHDRIDETARWLKPINDERNSRNIEQVERLNALLPAGILDPIDFERDVYPLSEAASGGSITERHILFALAKKIIETLGKGSPAVEFVSKRLGIELPAKIEGFLLDAGNPHYAYDLLGVLKGSMVQGFYVQPNEKECPHAAQAVKYANSIGAIPAYSYLGDVAESPTGDKKAEKFEDDYLDEMVPLMKELGFRAITYMPPRNTLEQLRRLQKLCLANGFMQISGVDINSSRQVFRCPEIMMPDFSHLIDSTWALIAHEHLASVDPDFAFFNPAGKFAHFGLDERLKIYAEAGRKMDLKNPEKIIEHIRRVK